MQGIMLMWPCIDKPQSVKNTSVTSHTAEPPSVTPPCFGIVKLDKLLIQVVVVLGWLMKRCSDLLQVLLVMQINAVCTFHRKLP